MMRDEELKKVLDQWEVPQASAELDARVRETYMQNKKRGLNWKLWGAVAAGVVLVVGLSLRRPAVQGTAPEARVETRMAAAGFQPMEDGAVTVVQVGAKQ